MAAGNNDENSSSEPVFKPLSAEDDSERPTEIESLCMECGENGVTTLLLTMIPHYREIILSSFECEHCGIKNNEVQSGGRIQERGVRFRCRIASVTDLARQVIKSDTAMVSVPEIELEIPANSQKGSVSTVEGVLQRTVTALEQDQPVRRHMDPEGAAKIEEYVAKIKDLLEVRVPFHILIDDPSGNSFIENLLAPKADPDREVTYYTRTKEQDKAVGIFEQDDLGAAEAEEGGKPTARSSQPTAVGAAEDGSTTTALTEERLAEEVLHFPTNCPDCNAPAETNMKVTKIPHFKEVVIMATSCDYCGHKTNEVKSGGGIEPRGTRITLRVTDPSDLSRDVLKSETCDLLLPDLEFEMGGHGLGGRFTTLEGLLRNVAEKLENNPFLGTGSADGDSATEETQRRLREFRAKLEELTEGKRHFTFVMDDPSGNSYLQNLYAPDPDPHLTVERYKRTWEQDEELGLNDIKTENYGEQESDERGCAALREQNRLLGAELGHQRFYVREVGAGTEKDALLLSPARAAIAEKDRRSQGSFRRSRGASPAMASPMMSDSEAGIVDGFNGNEEGCK